MLDFTITLKVKANQFKDGWLGVSFRKDVNDRYNGCNNNMVTLRFQPDKSIASQAYRGYTGIAARHAEQQDGRRLSRRCVRLCDLAPGGQRILL